MTHAEWAERKAVLAESLYRGQCGGSYTEAVLITCAAISAVAAHAWPGERIDRARFVQLLVREIPEAQIISVPLLVAHLEKVRRYAYARKLRRAFLPSSGSAVVTGADVDRSVADIRAQCPRLRVKDLRQFSYANLLYERLRSPLTHQYKTGLETVPFRMTDGDDVAVSYYNWAWDPGGGARPVRRRRPVRHIYFHLPWLAALTRNMGKVADAITRPLTPPTKWWIHRK